MSDKRTDQQLSSEIRDLIRSLQLQLVSHLDGIENTAQQRLLRLYDVWRQVILRRTTDTADGALSFFEQQRLVPACILTRSVVETTAVQYYVHKKLILHTEKADHQSIHKLFMSAVFGRRDQEWRQSPIQVLTAIDHLDKKFPGFRSEYDRLCEYVHPNLAGGYGTYVRREDDHFVSYFGNNPQGLEMGPWGQMELCIALTVANEIDHQLCLFHPQLVSMAEQHVPNTPPNERPG